MSDQQNEQEEKHEKLVQRTKVTFATPVFWDMFCKKFMLRKGSITPEVDGLMIGFREQAGLRSGVFGDYFEPVELIRGCYQQHEYLDAQSEALPVVPREDGTYEIVIILQEVHDARIVQMLLRPDGSGDYIAKTKVYSAMPDTIEAFIEGYQCGMAAQKMHSRMSVMA